MTFEIQSPFALVGLGTTGRSLMRLFDAYGLSRSDYVTYDAKDATADFSDPNMMLSQARPKTLIVSPGVPLSSPWIMDFKNSGGVLSSEFDLCSRLVTTEKIVAITGSVGKSTCTSLLGAAMAAVDADVFVGGNLGLAWSTYFADLKLGLRKKSKWQALEVSSYQIEGWREPLPVESVVLTYLSPNHLERYESLEAYYQVKWSLLARSKGAVFLNGDCVEISQAAARLEKPKAVCWGRSQDFNTGRALLLGDHNRQHLSLALHFIETFKLGAFAVDAVLSFQGLAHRCENVGERQGVLFVNDSKATAIESVQAAIIGLHAERKRRGGRLWVLLGGRDKKLPWANLLPSFRDPMHCPIYFGECRPVIRTAIGREGPAFEKLSMATGALKAFVKAGDIVLLSPGGTSLDEFKNFEERGDSFKSAIDRSFRQ